MLNLKISFVAVIFLIAVGISEAALAAYNKDCKDSDTANSLTIRGQITGIKKNGSTPVTLNDECNSNPNKVVQYDCQPQTGPKPGWNCANGMYPGLCTTAPFNCDPGTECSSGICKAPVYGCTDDDPPTSDPTKKGNVVVKKNGTVIHNVVDECKNGELHQVDCAADNKNYVSTILPSLDDGLSCTDDTCDAAAGVVKHVSNCAGGAPCTANGCDLCAGVNTDDGLNCTDDSCDPATGTVAHNPNCKEGEECTEEGQCEEIKCHHDFSFFEKVPDACPVGTEYTCKYNGEKTSTNPCPEGADFLFDYPNHFTCANGTESIGSTGACGKICTSYFGEDAFYSYFHPAGDCECGNNIPADEICLLPEYMGTLQIDLLGAGGYEKMTYCCQRSCEVNEDCDAGFSCDSQSHLCSQPNKCPSSDDPVDDNIKCTQDSCEPTTGEVIHKNICSGDGKCDPSGKCLFCKDYDSTNLKPTDLIYESGMPKVKVWDDSFAVPASPPKSGGNKYDQCLTGNTLKEMVCMLNTSGKVVYVVHAKCSDFGMTCKNKSIEGKQVGYCSK